MERQNCVESVTCTLIYAIWPLPCKRGVIFSDGRNPPTSVVRMSHNPTCGTYGQRADSGTESPSGPSPMAPDRRRRDEVTRRPTAAAASRRRPNLARRTATSAWRQPGERDAPLAVGDALDRRRRPVCAATVARDWKTIAKPPALPAPPPVLLLCAFRGDRPAGPCRHPPARPKRRPRDPPQAADGRPVSDTAAPTTPPAHSDGRTRPPSSAGRRPRQSAATPR